MCRVDLQSRQLNCVLLSLAMPALGRLPRCAVIAEDHRGGVTSRELHGRAWRPQEPMLAWSSSQLLLSPSAFFVGVLDFCCHSHCLQVTWRSRVKAEQQHRRYRGRSLLCTSSSHGGREDPELSTFHGRLSAPSCASPSADIPF